MGATKVAIVEDDARLRAVLTEVFSSSADCCCVGAFANGTAALAALPGLQPAVVFMDVNLPDLSGVECVERLAPQLPGTQIIMLTVYQDTETIFRALAVGAHGYLVKPVRPEKLLEAVREVQAGGVPMSRAIARQVIQTFRKPAPLPARVEAVAEESRLSEREQQVLNLLVSGFSYKEIAAQLGVSISSVSTYVQRVYEKLHVRTRREIIARRKSAAPGSVL